MASLALVRALSVDPAERRRPPRVPSASLVDRMKTIHEDELLVPSPIPRRKRYSGSSISRTPMPPSGATDRTQLLVPDERDEHHLTTCCTKSTLRGMLTATLALLTIVSMVTQMVCTPLYMDIMSDRLIGSDAFIGSFLAAVWQPIIMMGVIFFFTYLQNPRHCSVFVPSVAWSSVTVAGVLGGLSAIMVAFTSLPNRTQPDIQAILQQMSVPFTVFTRFILLRKGINRRQAACLFTLAIGIFISLEPSIFSIRKIGPWEYYLEDNPHAWYYYVIYGLSQLPLAFSYTLMEQGQNSTQVETLAYAAWYQVFVFLSYFLFVWIDFIPGFGMALAPPSGFFTKLRNGLFCFYAVEGECSPVPPLAAVFTLSTAGTSLLSILLIRYAEGALFTVIVMTVATPLTALFWTLFSAQDELHWAPQADISTGFLVVGLLIMMPSVIMYAYFREEDTSPQQAEAERARREALDAEARAIRKERARRERKKRRRRTMTHLYTPGASVDSLLEQDALKPFSKSAPQSSRLQRVKSAPVVFAGF